MQRFVEHLEAVTNAPNVETLWALHVAKMDELGFDRILYGNTNFRSGASLGDPQDWVLLTNHGDSYMQGFIDEGHVHNAPMIRWALENTGPCSWLWLADQENELSAAEMDVVRFNMSQNVTAGYTVSFLSFSERSKGAIALTGRSDLTQEDVEQIWNEHGRAITVLNNVMHLKMQTLPYSPRRLTQRQKEVLQWVGDGKTTQDIAILLDLTPATIEKHMRLARETLGVETTAQAVLKASFYNQMFVVDAKSN